MIDATCHFAIPPHFFSLVKFIDLMYIPSLFAVASAPPPWLPCPTPRLFLRGRNLAMHHQEQHHQVVPRGERTISQCPLFVRITKSGRDYLLRHGWTQRHSFEVDGNIPQYNMQRLAFAWTSKSGPQFEMNDVSGPHVRPFPKHWTDAFDDKLMLAQALGETTMAPKCVTSPTDEDVLESSEESLYFVKHRYGAQGKSVYVYNKNDLLEWYNKYPSRNVNDFVIQEEIVPALYNGRKFVLRCHILLILQNNHPLRAFLHRKSIICQHHAADYQKGVTDRCSQISQAEEKKRRKLPLPILMDDLESDHPASNAYDKIWECSQELIRAVVRRNTINCTMLASETTCFALLGSDILMNESGDIKVCEVNSHPALGWGTMSKVPSGVFTNLIEEMFFVLLLNGNIDETGFDILF